MPNSDLNRPRIESPTSFLFCVIRPGDSDGNHGGPGMGRHVEGALLEFAKTSVQPAGAFGRHRDRSNALNGHLNGVEIVNRCLKIASFEGQSPPTPHNPAPERGMENCSFLPAAFVDLGITAMALKISSKEI